MIETPTWLNELVEAAHAYANAPMELECWQLNVARMEDQQHPDRLCHWCFHPRSSPECNFAQQHTPYREMFGPNPEETP